MAKGLLLDDHPGFVAIAGKTAAEYGIETATSCAQARALLVSEQFESIIADWIFDSEEDDGIAFLEYARQRAKRAQLYLLTNHELGDHDRERLKKIQAVMVSKGALSAAKLRDMASGTYRGGESGDGIDYGQLRLETERLREQYEQVCALNDALIEDIVGELSNIKNQSERTVLIGNARLSVEELRREIENRSDIGQKIVKWHMALNRKLRG